MEFELREYETAGFLGQPASTTDLGNTGKGNFTEKRRINISDLQPRQTHVNGGTLNLKLKGKFLTTPYVVITKDAKILIDGHHTVIAKKLKGQTSVNALCYTVK